ncbi:regulatory protein, luxR family [Alkalicoccus daliensis]|uniref:Regulatory protein, luxR family n=2 Tax=Alkalicoccus daliensis TaxID=745820 RepID=A0A1H0G755_9BACI|nr:regulatory protein, luxR family [Alkalicoccus daliensis]
MKNANQRSIALICMDEAYKEVLGNVKAPEDVKYDYITYEDEEYVSTFDSLFIFSDDPVNAVQEQQTRPTSVDWSKKAIVFIVPEKNLELAAGVLEYEVAGLISCEQFLAHGSKAMETLMDYSFILEPVLNFKVAEEVKKRKQRQSPVKRFVLDKEKVNVPLKKAEFAILQLLLDGKGTAEMAEELFYSVKTVKRYISNLIRSIGVTDRTGVVVHAIRNEWVTCERDEAILPFSNVKASAN